MVLPNNKKSITVVIDNDEDPNIDYVFIIKSINVDKITVDKFDIDYRYEIENAWDNSGSIHRKIVVKLVEKISTITLVANAKAIEKAVEYSGQIIRNIVVTRPPKARKVRISDIELFDNIKE